MCIYWLVINLNINEIFFKMFLISIKGFTSADLDVSIFSTSLIIENFKIKYLCLRQVWVMCSSILNKQTANSSLHKTKNEISYISLQTHHILWNVYCNIEVSTYPQNGDIVVEVVLVTPVIKSSSHIVNWSGIVVFGASSYSERGGTRPKYGKILNFALCMLLRLNNITHSFERLEKK